MPYGREVVFTPQDTGYYLLLMVKLQLDSYFMLNLIHLNYQ